MNNAMSRSVLCVCVCVYMYMYMCICVYMYVCVYMYIGGEGSKAGALWICGVRLQ